MHRAANAVEYGTVTFCTVAARDLLLGLPVMIAFVLGLASGVTWGVADFMGGLSSRRMHAAAVAAISQLVGAIGLLAVVVVRQPTLPAGSDLILAGLAGVGGGVGLLAFYRALGVGTMSVVAPISALSAGLPLAVGLARGERPGTLALIGVFIALAGAVMASRGPGHATVRGAGLALVAAAGFGAYFVLLEPAADTSVLWAVLAARFASVPIVVAASVALSASWRMRGGLAWLVVGAGALDVAANLMYAQALTTGDLSVVAVLSGLYPVSTVLLAQAVLKERVTVTQGLGVLAALVGVGFIAAG